MVASRRARTRVALDPHQALVYRPLPGSTDATPKNCSRLLGTDLTPYRDELVVTTKTGYNMWPGHQWRSRLAEVLGRESRPEPRATEARLRRHLLAPSRPGHAARGGARRPRLGCPAGEGALRRYLVVLRRLGLAKRSRSKLLTLNPTQLSAECGDDAEAGERGGEADRLKGPLRCRSGVRRCICQRPDTRSRSWEAVSQPAGEVTLVFSDIEGSTRLLEELGTTPTARRSPSTAGSCARPIARYSGYEVDYEGDAFFYTFASRPMPSRRSRKRWQVSRQARSRSASASTRARPSSIRPSTWAWTCTRRRGS